MQLALLCTSSDWCVHLNEWTKNYSGIIQWHLKAHHQWTTEPFLFKHMRILVCLDLVSVGFPNPPKAGSDFWHCEETLQPSSQTKHGRGWQQGSPRAKSCSLSWEMKGICLLCQNIARSCSYGLVPCHGAVALGFLMCGWNSWCANACWTCIVHYPRVASMPFGYYESNSWSVLTFSCSGSAQIQIISGYILGVQVCGWDPALLLCCADKPPACRGRKGTKQWKHKCGYLLHQAAARRQ